MRNRIISWTSYLAAAALVATPFVGSQDTLDPVLLPRLVFWSVTILLMGILLLVASVKSQPVSFPWRHRLLVQALLGYLILVAVSSVTAMNPTEAIFETSRAALFSSVLLLFALVLRSDQSAFGLIARGLTLVAGVVALIGLAQYYQVAFNEHLRDAGLANRNLLASALCLMLPFLLYVRLQAGLFWRRAALVGIVPVIAMVMLTNSRATWFALILSGAVAILALWTISRQSQTSGSQRRTIRRRLIPLVSVAAATALLFSTSWVRNVEQESVLDRAITASSFNQGSVAERLAMWQNSLRMFADHPLLGVGPGNWKLAHPAYGPICERQLTDNVSFQRPHNDFLWILTESGAPALLCYLTLLLAALLYALKTIRTTVSFDDRIKALAVLSGLTLFMIISCFSYPKERMVHSLLMALMVATALTTCRQDDGRTDGGRFWTRIVLLMTIVVSVGSLILGLHRWSSESHIIAALHARNRADWPTVVQGIDLASSRWVQFDHTATPLAWYRGVANFSMNRHDTALDDFRNALSEHPNHRHVLNNLATSYELRGNHDSAIFYYQRALEIAPGFEDATINLAAVFYNVERYEAALETLVGLGKPVTDPRFESYMERIKTKLAEETEK